MLSFQSYRNIIKTKITEGSAYRLTHNTQGRTGLDTSSIRINTVAEKLKSVNNKEKDTFNQRAWHGSGMDFNEFNLEKALTGAGDMVHGRFTRLKTKRRPGHIKNTQKVKDYRHTSTK